VPKDTPVEGEIGQMAIPGGTYAVARFELTNEEFEAAWDMVMGGWMPESGYQPDDRLCYELYHNNPDQHPEKKLVVDICVPVKPL
jgi:AraC family transcriptional regulator